jgi:glycine/D-amino acid oxidase-like deaminating enzyme
VKPAGPVVVVGGGIAGLTAALELAERGAAVTLV